jgi:hypothetical protein
VLCPQLTGHCDTVVELRATCWQDLCATVEAAHTRLAKEIRYLRHSKRR